MTPRPWTILGFTADQMVGAWQDARLAEAVARAWHEAGRPGGCRILQAPGEGPHLVYWFVCPFAAALLDAARVQWREFAVGERGSPPAGARAAVRLE